MTKLIIGNVDNEHQVADVSRYTRQEQSEIILCNQRMLWMARPGDVVVLPRAPEPEIVAYWAKLNGCATSDITLLAPRTDGPCAFLRQEELFAPGFIAECRAVIAALPEDRRPNDLLAYFPDNYMAEFAREIGVEVDDRFHREGGATLLNQKTAFRKIAAGLGVPIPEGAISDNAADLRRAILRMVAAGKDFIIKLDRHSGGFGNLIVHGPRTSGRSQGSSSVQRYDTVEEGRALCERIVPRVTEAAVVEEYLPTETVLYSEYLIEGPGRFRHLNDGTMDMEPLWVGFEIPGSYAQHHRTQFLDHSARIVAAVSQLGYRGYINIDGLVANGSCHVNEINGRCGGCTHIFEIVRRQFGDRVLGAKHIKSYNHGICRERGQLVATLAAHGLLFEPGKESGVIPFNVDYDLENAFEYMTVTNSPEEARRLSERTLAVFRAQMVA